MFKDYVNKGLTIELTDDKYNQLTEIILKEQSVQEIKILSEYLHDCYIRQHIHDIYAQDGTRIYKRLKPKQKQKQNRKQRRK